MKQNAITLGRIGVLLPLASIIPYLGSLTGLASVILLLISFNYFSKHYEDQRIFSNYLWGFVISIGCVVLGVIMIILAFGSNIIESINNYSEVEDMMRNVSIAQILLAVALIYVGYSIGAYFQYVSMKILAEKSNVKEFSTAGLLTFIGSLSTILLGLGFILLFIGWIFKVIAFFNIKEDGQDYQQNQYTN